MEYHVKQSTTELIFRGLVPCDSSDSSEGTCNVVVYTIDGEYYRAQNCEENVSNDGIDLLSLRGDRIPIQHIRPIFPKRFTIAPQPLLTNLFVKKPQLATYDGRSSFTPARSLLEEARILEYFTKFPHPNIAKYHGCVLEGDRISGLCLTKYTVTLRERILFSQQGKLPFPTSHAVEAWCDEVKRGLNHLHSHGYVHKDLDPRNVMLDSEDSAIIIDFDSCQKEGKPLGPKSHGTPPWIDKQNARGKTSDRDHDFEGLRVIRSFLERYQISEEPCNSDEEGSEYKCPSEVSESDEDHELGDESTGKRKSCDRDIPEEDRNVPLLRSHRAKRQRISAP